MARHLPVVVLVALLTAGCSADGPDTDPDVGPTGSTTSAGADADVLSAWSTPFGEVPFQTERAIDDNAGNEGPNPIDAGERTVVLGQEQVSGLETATGAIDWSVRLDAPVCASAPRANDAGTVVVLTAAAGDGTCTDVVALAASDGSTLWTAPIPRAARAAGHEVSLGDDAVMVSGECAGATILSAADGAVVADLPGELVDGVCSSAAGDGTSLLVSSRGRLAVYDAAGERTRDVAVDGLGRVGDVVSSDPLVVSAVVGGQGRLVSLAADRPVVTGRESNTFGGVPEAAAFAGGLLWVQYDGVSEVVGFDPASGEEAASIATDPDADRLEGVLDDRLVLTAGLREGSTTRTELRRYDPASPDAPQVVGVLPAPDDGDQGLSSSAVVGDVLVRIWLNGTGGRVEGITLPAGGAGGSGGTDSSGDPSQAA